MRKYFTALIVIPLGLFFIVFAVANRHFVTVSFDPFASMDKAALSLEAPMFAVIIVVAMLGVVGGACATWISQRRHRRAARRNRAEADKWRTQVETLTAHQGGSSTQALPSH